MPFLLRFTLLTLLLAIVRSSLAAEEPPPVKIRIRTFDREDYNGRILLNWGKTSQSTVNYRGSNADIQVAEINIPPGDTEISFKGELKWTHYQAGPQTSSGTSRRKIIDITQLMAPLRREDTPWSARLNQFSQAQEKFEAAHPELAAEVSPRFEPGDRATPLQIENAEQRLNFPLPASYKSLLLEYGSPTLLDSFFTHHADLRNAHEQMRLLWETPAEDLAALPEKIRQLLKSGTILFTEVGDGYSALLCTPAPSNSKLDTQKQSVLAKINTPPFHYYWISQDDIVNPTLLKNDQEQPLDDSDALRWLIANQILVSYENAGADSTFIDFGSPSRLTYNLEPLFPAPKTLAPRLLLDWKNFH